MLPVPGYMRLMAYLLSLAGSWRCPAACEAQPSPVLPSFIPPDALLGSHWRMLCLPTHRKQICGSMKVMVGMMAACGGGLSIWADQMGVCAPGHLEGGATPFSAAVMDHR